MKYNWKRPFKETTHYPLIYSVFESNSAENDTPQVFRIEDIEEDRFSEVIDMMKKSYLSKNPMMRSKNVEKDENSVKEITDYWRTILDQKVSILCLHEETNTIAGVDLLNVISEDEYDFKPKGETWSEIRHTLRFIKNIFFNPFENYGVDKILTTGGCHVDMDFQNHGIEKQLIKARLDVGKLFDVRICSDYFVESQWQNAAMENGFDESFSMSFKKLPKLIPEGYFPAVQAENLKMFSKKIY